MFQTSCYRLDASNGIVAVRQEAMTQLRDVEATLREENRLMNSSIVELKGSIVEKDLKLEEITQDLSAEKSEAEVTNTRNSDLLCRCNKLSDELQLERKARCVHYVVFLILFDSASLIDFNVLFVEWMLK